MHLIHIISGNRWGGVERYALDISRHYRDMGWHVSALTRDAKAIDNLFAAEGINLIHSPLWGMWDLSSARVLARLLESTPENHTVVHVHGFRNAFTALLARKIAGRKDVRVVVTRHKVSRGTDNWIFRRIYRNIDAVIFVSQLAATRFLQTWRNRELPFDPSKMHVIHNSLNIPDSEPCGRNGKKPVCAMWHGPLIPGKGIETLIDALTFLKGSRIRLRIVGSGDPDYTDTLRRRALNRGVMEMIDWHKHSPNPLPLIADCDFGVLPSAAEEAFGMANIEYMACGRPQACSSSGAQPEYLTDGSEAFLVVPGNPSALAEAMRKLASDSGLRERMGHRAFVSFRNNLSWTQFISRLNEIYIPENATVLP